MKNKSKVDFDYAHLFGKGPKKKARDKVADLKHWDTAELDLFLKTAKEEYYETSQRFYYDLFLIYALTGMRRNEALALRREDIDFKSNYISVDQAVTRDEHGKVEIGFGKNINSTRNIAVGQKLIEEIADYLKWQDDVYFPLFHIKSQGKKQLLFPNRKNNPLVETKPSKIEAHIIEKHRLPFKPIGIHGFRYTYATLALSGDDALTPSEVQYQLGHSDPKITLAIYASITKKQKMRSGQKFEDKIVF